MLAVFSCLSQAEFLLFRIYSSSFLFFPLSSSLTSYTFTVSDSLSFWVFLPPLSPSTRFGDAGACICRRSSTTVRELWDVDRRYLSENGFTRFEYLFYFLFLFFSRSKLVHELKKWLLWLGIVIGVTRFLVSLKRTDLPSFVF